MVCDDAPGPGAAAFGAMRPAMVSHAEDDLPGAPGRMVSAPGAGRSAWSRQALTA
jgi:hypothetical protein